MFYTKYYCYVLKGRKATSGQKSVKNKNMVIFFGFPLKKEKIHSKAFMTSVFLFILSWLVRFLNQATRLCITMVLMSFVLFCFFIQTKAIFAADFSD